LVIKHYGITNTIIPVFGELVDRLQLSYFSLFIFTSFKIKLTI
jgi:hypothetical protein